MKIRLDDVKQAARTHLGLQECTVSLLGSGQSNTNFLVNDTYVIRVNADSTAIDKIDREYAVLQTLKGQGIAPKVFVKDTSKTIIPQEYLIIEYFPGSDVSRNILNNKLILDLARLTAKFHNSSTQGVRVEKSTYENVKKNILKYVDETRTIGGVIEANFLEANAHELRTDGPTNVLTLTHGDICDKNTVYTSDGELRFIDFESCARSDPAYDISDIFTAFGKEFQDSDKELFFTEYFRYRTDQTLRERVSVFIPLKLFETLCWSVMHVYKVYSGALSEDIQSAHSLQEHIDYAHSSLKQCEQQGLIVTPIPELFTRVQ